MPFLYGNHVLKAHLGRITEDTPEHQGVVVYSMNDVPLVINWLCVSYNLSSSMLAHSGVRGYIQINSGYTENGPDSHRRFSSSVRICKLFSLPSAHASSCPRDVGEYLRDEVKRFSRGHHPPTLTLNLAGYVVLSSVLAACAKNTHLHYYYVIV